MGSTPHSFRFSYVNSLGLWNQAYLPFLTKLHLKKILQQESRKAGCMRQKIFISFLAKASSFHHDLNPWLTMAENESGILRRTRQSTVYIIASTNRTGSYLLCEGLDCTNIAGRPTEALSPEYRHELCRFLYGREADFSVSIKTVIRHSMTPNGVFGAKVHWDQVEEIALESGYEGAPYVFLLDEFPGARYIHLSRRNTLAQAISLYIAQQTEEWWRLTGLKNPYKRSDPPIFNAVEILRLERNLIWQRDAWEAFFKVEGITPLRMEYEALAADYRGEVERVLDFLGLESAIAQAIPEPRLQKQGDELNALWEHWLKLPQEALAIA